MSELTVCFTGHRPPKFNNENSAFIREKLTECIGRLIDEGCVLFVSGMALGVDMLAAEIVLEYKKTRPEIRLECAVPCRGQEKRWGQSAKREYAGILSRADTVTVLSEHYTPWCMQFRNVYMVDKSDAVVAVFDGTPGGTANTVAYAKRRGKKIIQIPCGNEAGGGENG